MTIAAEEQRIATLQQEIDKAGQRLTRDRMRQAKPRAATDRQTRLNVATICNAEWLDSHTLRFIHLCRRAMPDASYTLLYIGDGDALKASKTPDLFDHVHSATVADKDAPGYLSYNAPRYGLCSLMDCDEVLYLDPDIDVVADISAVADDCKSSLGWCRSPIEPGGFAAAMQKVEKPAPKVWANSGTLLLRDDFSKQYADAAQLAVESGITSRLVGNFAFSVMLQSGGINHSEIPYKYGSIWWDKSNFARACCLHYCNDRGKARRNALSSVWVG